MKSVAGFGEGDYSNARSFTTVVDRGSVVISQVYGGGGNSGAQYKNDFIELFNRSELMIDLTNWSVQYAASGSASWSVTPLSGSIGPRKYYLIQLASGGANGATLPTPDSGRADCGTNREWRRCVLPAASHATTETTHPHLTSNETAERQRRNTITEARDEEGMICGA